MNLAKRITVLDLGRKSFQEAMKIQERCSRKLLDQTLKGKSCAMSPDNYLLMVEHNPVYTIGIRRQGYSDEDENKLRSLGADFHQTNRGGLITFHGQGQLVAYPVIHLKYFKMGMRHYICQLERTIMRTCSEFGIKTHTSFETGVWVGDNKIAAIGVHGARYVTTHGIGLNCNVDLGWFDHIIPCGIEGKGVTSVTKEIGRDTSITEVIPPFLDAFSKEFHCEYEQKKFEDCFDVE